MLTYKYILLKFNFRTINDPQKCHQKPSFMPIWILKGKKRQPKVHLKYVIHVIDRHFDTWLFERRSRSRLNVSTDVHNVMKCRWKCTSSTFRFMYVHTLITYISVAIRTWVTYISVATRTWVTSISMTIRTWSTSCTKHISKYIVDVHCQFTRRWRT